MHRGSKNLAAAAFVLTAFLATGVQAQGAPRGVIPRSKAAVTVDGKLTEWGGAFATPVNFGHADWANRAAVFHYLWDDQNLYIALESLDTEIFNKAPGPIYNGDGVEFYLDTREKPTPEWQPGALHLFFTAASNGEIEPRIQVRGGIPAFKDVTPEGMEAAAVKTAAGYTLEFKLPWSKLGGFKPTAGREIGIDCELCSSDGAARVDRCWVYSGVSAVGNPASIGRVKLVDSWDPVDAAAYSDVLFPSFLARSTPLNEPATVFLAISPAMQGLVKRVEMSAGGKVLPFVGVKRFGPCWARAQGCLVGFVAPTDTEVTVRFLGEGDKVLGTRVVPLK